MPKHKNSRAKSKSTFAIFSSFSGWAIIFLLCVIGVFLGSFFWETPSRSVERVVKPPKSVTLQILNGCGENGAAQRLAEALLPGDSLQVYDIIEKGDTPLATFEKTTVVDRRSSGDGHISEEALGVASRLGIEGKNIIMLRLEDNILNIDVTVIAGKDYGAHVAKLKKAKEALL